MQVLIVIDLSALWNNLTTTVTRKIILNYYVNLLVCRLIKWIPLDIMYIQDKNHSANSKPPYNIL